MSIVDSAGKYLEVNDRYLALRGRRIEDGNKRLARAYKRQKENRLKIRAYIGTLFARIVRSIR